MNFGKVPLEDGMLPMLKTVRKKMKYNDADENARSNTTRQRLAVRQNLHLLNGELFGSTSHAGQPAMPVMEEPTNFTGLKGQGYLNAPSGGYLNAPSGGYLHAPNRGGVQGGFFPALIPIASALAPSLIQGLFSLFKGKGVSASDFYKHADKMVEVHHPKAHGKYQKAMHKLFAGKGNYNRILRGKQGAGKNDQLKVGHLILPPLIGHVQKLMKGQGGNVPDVVDLIEKQHGGILEEDFTSVVSGSGWIEGLWSGVKSILGKIIPMLTSDTAKGIYKNVGTTLAQKGAEEVGKLGVKGIEKLSNKVQQKMGNGMERVKGGFKQDLCGAGYSGGKKGWVVSI